MNNKVRLSVTISSVNMNLLDGYCVRTGFTKSKLVDLLMFFGLNSGDFRDFLGSVESITKTFEFSPSDDMDF